MNPTRLGKYTLIEQLGKGITAVEVELSTHTELDWEQNLAALLAFLNWDLD